MKFNIIFNKKSLEYKDVLSRLEQTLISKKILFKTFELENMENFGDFTLAIGGDGTFLKVARFYSEWKTPVMGINIGRLGFLSQVEGLNEEFNFLIDDIINGDFYIEERMMLESQNNIALNDFVIKGTEQSRTSKLYLEINDKEVCDYIADGLIISTPTGSTAYGLSAGGPIVYPTMEAITIIPICPHTLNVRPLVIPSNEILTVKTREKLLSVSIDGYETKNYVEKIKIKAADKKALLAFLNNSRFYTVLRNKLHWGVCPISI